jgi:hypothetical protein
LLAVAVPYGYGCISVALSKLTSPALNAIRQALATVSKLPESEEARELRDQCLAHEHIAEQWAREPPTPEEREALMKKVLALHVKVTKVHRSSFPPPPDRGDD